MSVRGGASAALLGLGLALVSVTPSAEAADYALAEVRHVQVASHDGTVLDGFVSLPTLKPGERAPVVLISTPYLSTVMADGAAGPLVLRDPESQVSRPGSGTWWDDYGPLEFDQALASIGVHPIRWIRRGFVLAQFSIRGSGASGGCFDAGGRKEQLDQRALVEWLARQPWSNGRVGMGGLSYPGFTTWQAAVQNPPALKAIVGIAPIIDMYEYLYTPQAALQTAAATVVDHFWPQYSNPPVLGDPARLATYAGRAGCTGGLEPLHNTYGSMVSEMRSRAWFEERDLTPRLRDVRAAVLHAQGFMDLGHLRQDATLTASLHPKVPFREVRGWWRHVHPSETPAYTPPPGSGETSWEDVVTRWFSYWLKGVGDKPRLGVDHRDQLGTWHRDTAWPPPTSSTQTLYLTEGALRETPGGRAATFWSTPPAELGALSMAFDGPGVGGTQVCLPSGQALTYSLKAGHDMVVSGNPRLQLRLSSDQPAGVVGVDLYLLGPDFDCASNPVGATWLGTGAIDLAYYLTRYAPRPFPVGRAVEVPIDLTDVTARIPAGSRLAVVISHGEITERLSRPGDYPHITAHSDGGALASRILLPVRR